MNALDTNALVRFLVNDDEKQALAVKKTVLETEKKGERLFIPLAVILETIWVLSSVYEHSTENILHALEGLLCVAVFKIDEHDRVSKMCHRAAVQDVDPADLIIGLTSLDHGCATTLTFDKKAARSELFTLI